MFTDLIKCKNQCLHLDTVVVPRLDARRENAYSDTGSPDGVLSGTIFRPENSLGTGC